MKLINLPPSNDPTVKFDPTLLNQIQTGFNQMFNEAVPRRVYMKICTLNNNKKLDPILSQHS